MQYKILGEIFFHLLLFVFMQFRVYIVAYVVVILIYFVLFLQINIFSCCYIVSIMTDSYQVRIPQVLSLQGALQWISSDT